MSEPFQITPSQEKSILRHMCSTVNDSENSSYWQNNEQMNTGPYDKCRTASQEILVPFIPQVGYKEATLPCSDLQSFFNVTSISLQREGGVRMVVSSFKCPF